MDGWGDRLWALDAVVSATSDGATAVTVHVEADTAHQAMATTSVVDEILGDEPIGLQVLTEDEYDRRARSNSVPELMSAADIAHHLGVTRQRVHQLRTTAQFPKPLAELRGGAVWDGAAIRAFARTWERKPGRPVASTPAVHSMHILVPYDTPELQVRRLIRNELNHRLHNTEARAMRIRFREDPLPNSEEEGLRRYEVVFGTAPGSTPDDTMIPVAPTHQVVQIEPVASAPLEYPATDVPLEYPTTERNTIVTNKRIVQHRDDGNWEVRKPGAPRASEVVRTQSEGIERARTILGNNGGGELQVRGRDGTIRAQDTVAPGNDPRRSKG